MASVMANVALEFAVMVIPHLELQDGDIVVISVPGHLATMEHERLQEAMKTAFGNDQVRALVLEEGMQVRGLLRWQGGQEWRSNGQADEAAA